MTDPTPAQPRDDEDPRSAVTRGRELFRNPAARKAKPSRAARAGALLWRDRRPGASYDDNGPDAA